MPRDWVEQLYHQETGVFVPPTWLVSIPLSQWIIDEDKVLNDLQGHWGMMALALPQDIVMLKAAILMADHSAETNLAAAGSALSTLKDEINSQVLAPWHMLYAWPGDILTISPGNAGR